MLEMKRENEIILINRSVSYSISKSLICSKIPLFKELCSEFVQNFQFNLNELCFESIINWLYSDWIVINMDNVLSMHEVSDELKIESIKNACHSFFNENFSAKQIPCLLHNVRADTSLLNFNMLNSFLSKNFSRIMNGEYFLEFPLEVVKYILSLDLSIQSEYQVFLAISKWIKHEQSRIVHLPSLMKCIRWCYTFKNCYEKIKEDEFIVLNLPQMHELSCEPGECRNSCLNSRVKDKYLISLYSLENQFIGISYYTEDGCWEPCGSFEPDHHIPLDFITKEHVFDIIFDSGRCGLRIDFVQKKYRWLEMSGSPLAFYNRLYECFKPKFDRPSSYRAYIQDEVKKIDHWVDLEKNTLIEDKGVMNIICYTQKDQKLYCFLPVEHIHWYNNPFDGYRVHAIVLDDIYYIITKSLTFRIFDFVKKTLEKYRPFEGMNLSFEDLILDSFKSNVILLIKSQRKIMMFDTRKKIWTLMGQIYSNDAMIALTSTDIPVKFIKKLYTKKRVI